MMKKLLTLGFAGIALAACSDRVGDPMEFVKETTIGDTYDFCMRVHANEEYCGCEVEDLEKTFPWQDYMAAIDAVADERDHVAKTIEKFGGGRAKILEDLNCPTCYFAIALGAVNVNPSPRCAEFLK
jgi:hypothetical protein